MPQVQRAYHFRSGAPMHRGTFGTLKIARFFRNQRSLIVCRRTYNSVFTAQHAISTCRCRNSPASLVHRLNRGGKSMKRFFCLVMSLAVGSLSCSPSDSSPASLKTNPRRTSSIYGYENAPQFSDDAKTNAKVESDTLDLSFIDRKGKRVDLKSFQGKKNVVLVVTRGYSGHLCPYCTAQTSRLITQYDEFAKRDAEV